MAVWDTKCGVLDGLVTAWGSPTAPTPTLNQIICDPPGNAWPSNVWEWNVRLRPQHIVVIADLSLITPLSACAL